MHHLSIRPSLRDRRASRNSYGASLPIPRVKRQTQARPELSHIPSFDVLAAQAQDMAQEKVATAKNMAFAFDIDGVLVHGDRLIPQGAKVLQILNGDNEIGIKVSYPRRSIHRDSF